VKGYLPAARLADPREEGLTMRRPPCTTDGKKSSVELADALFAAR